MFEFFVFDSKNQRPHPIQNRLPRFLDFGPAFIDRTCHRRDSQGNRRFVNRNPDIGIPTASGQVTKNLFRLRLAHAKQIDPGATNHLATSIETWEHLLAKHLLHLAGDSGHRCDV